MPASRRRLSRAPSPVSCTGSFESSLATSAVSDGGIEIYGTRHAFMVGYLGSETNGMYLETIFPGVPTASDVEVETLKGYKCRSAECQSLQVK